MRCQRCSAEIPSQAQFCMQCGAPVAAARPRGAVTMSRPVAVPGSRPKKGLIVGVAAAMALAAIAGVIGMKLLNPTGSRVVQATGSPLRPGPLTEGAGRVRSAGPLTDTAGKITPPAPEPVDIIDYLKFLKDIERQRLILYRQQKGKATAIMTAGTQMLARVVMSEDWEQAMNEESNKIQRVFHEFPPAWHALSQRFLSKPAPQACSLLRDKYYDMLTKVPAVFASLGNTLQQVFGGGDPQKALEMLHMQRGSGMGTPAGDYLDALRSADEELANVCAKYNLRKDFDIKEDGGVDFLSGTTGVGGLP